MEKHTQCSMFTGHYSEITFWVKYFASRKNLVVTFKEHPGHALLFGQGPGKEHQLGAVKVVEVAALDQVNPRFSAHGRVHLLEERHERVKDGFAG